MHGTQERMKIVEENEKKHSLDKAKEEMIKLSFLLASGAKVKKCPFCGSTNAEPRIAITEDGHVTYTVLCNSCGVGIFRARETEDEWRAFKDAEEAIDAWNARKEDRE